MKAKLSETRRQHIAKIFFTIYTNFSSQIKEEEEEITLVVDLSTKHCLVDQQTRENS